MHQFEWDERGCTVRFFGEVGIDEINRANGTLHGDHRFAHNGYSIWDLTAVSQLKVSADEARKPAVIDRAAARSVARFKVAIVSDNELFRALIEAFIADAFVHIPDWQFSLFDTMEAADGWVHEQKGR